MFDKFPIYLKYFTSIVVIIRIIEECQSLSQTAPKFATALSIRPKLRCFTRSLGVSGFQREELLCNFFLILGVINFMTRNKIHPQEPPLSVSAINMILQKSTVFII